MGNKSYFLMKIKKSHIKIIILLLICIISLWLMLYFIWNLTGKNLDTTFFNASSSIIISLATIFYVILTYLLVKETVLLRKESYRPIITIEIVLSEIWFNFLNLEVKNIGKGIAYDIKFKIKNNADNPLVQQLNTLEFIKTKINYLSPERTIKTFLTNLAQDFEKKTSPFSIIVEYSDLAGNLFEEEFNINLSVLKGTSSVGKNPLNEIADNLTNINRALGSIERKIN